MSEYQYYEFLALDQPLTNEQMAELRRCSTRAEISSTRFFNEYHWGDLKGDPRRWMEQYFDAFLYFANWGSHWLMLRLPTALLPPHQIRDYASEEALEIRKAGDHTILSFTSEIEEPDREGESYSLGSLAALRSALIAGDRRSLYLGWLSGIHDAEDLSPEPPVPPGLAELDASHRALADFLRIGPDLLAVAAERSAPLQDAMPDQAAFAGWVQALSPTHKDALLTELLVSAGPYPLAALRQRAERELGAANPAHSGQFERRTAAALWRRAKQLAGKRRAHEARERAAAEARQEAEEAARRRLYLQALRGREDALWQTIETLIETRQASTYGQAVAKLQDLRDLAALDQQTAAFRERMSVLSARHAKKQTLIRRFREAKLFD